MKKFGLPLWYLKYLVEFYFRVLLHEKNVDL